MKKQKGMTIVETIVAFSILLIAIALFYGSIRLSSKLIAGQNDRRKRFEEMVDIYYKNEVTSVPVDPFSLTISNGSGFPSDLFKDIKLKQIINSEGGVIYYYEK